jgi:predicted PurR-regulated permease PerM
MNRVLDNPPSWLPEIAVDFELPGLSNLIEQVATLGGQFFGNFVSFFSGSVITLLQILLLFALIVMFLSDPQAYRKLLLRLFPSSYRSRADAILSKCEWSLLCWLGGVSTNSIFVATLSFVGLVVLRVPYPFANAMLAGLFNFIPNIGPAISAIFPIIVALSQSFSSAIAVIILYVVIQNLESYWFSPIMMQKRVSLLPAATLIVQLFFANFLGPMGLILALPLAVVCKTWIEEAWIVDVLEKSKAPDIPSGEPLPTHEQTPVPNSEAPPVHHPEP